MKASDPLDKAAIAREMEAVRTAYHELLARLPEDALGRRSRNPDMLVKELMWHMAWSMGCLSRCASTKDGQLVERLQG